jgi:hypothetical protein
LKSERALHVILETKGYDPLEDVKRAAAERWVAAVNADGSFGCWRFVLIKKPFDIGPVLTAALEAATRTAAVSAGVLHVPADAGVDYWRRRR